MKTRIQVPTPAMRRNAGFSLVELMIALLIGLLIAAAGGTMFYSNKQAYATTETLGRIQENGRVAFELMARAIREAGGTPCGRNIPIVSTVSGPGGVFGWGNGIEAFEDMPEEFEVGNYVDETDVLLVQTGSTGNVSVSKQPAGKAARLFLTDSSGIVRGDILMVCDFKSAAIFMASIVDSNGIIHNQGVSIGGYSNDCKYLRFPRCATGSTADPKNTFPAGSPVAKFRSDIWYIGTNGRGGTSLYRKSQNGSPEELVEGVADMTLEFLVPGQSTYARPSANPDWGQVNAVRLTLALESTEGTLAGRNIEDVDGERYSRDLVHVVTLRNRMP